MPELSTPMHAQLSVGEPVVCGVPLAELIAGASFSDVICLLLRGGRPSDAERLMLDAMLVAVADHGAESPSTTLARTSATSGNALHVAIAAGVLGMGPRHGCAIEGAMRLFASEEDPAAVIARERAAGRRIPGFGHRLYAEEDPRTRALFGRARELGCAGHAVERSRTFERALAATTSKTLPLNVDGAIAALLVDLRFPPESGNAIFVIGRIPGLAAHALTCVPRREQPQEIDVMRRAGASVERS